jgi:uncharacterized protein (TIGR03118 family)
MNTTKANIRLVATVTVAVALGQGPTLGQYLQQNLAGVQNGMAHYTDPRLNGWGMVQMPEGPFCVADPPAGVATFYNRSGKPLPTTITVPSGSGTGTGLPAGLVYNPTDDFVISKNGKSAPARLIFSTLDGTLSGWNPAVDRDSAVVMVNNSATESYPGLAIGKNGRGENVLYVADWGANLRFEVFDGGFHDVGSFTDPAVASEYAAFGPFPFGVDYEEGKVWVTYGMGGLTVPLSFGGVVDVFDGDGNLLTPSHFAANAPGAGPLENPWAFVRTPARFGEFGNSMLIGNVEGPGHINAFNPDNAAFLGQLTNSNGEPLAIPGLWEMLFPHDSPGNGQSNPLFFTAGPNAISFDGNGLFGTIMTGSGR